MLFKGINRIFSKRLHLFERVFSLLILFFIRRGLRSSRVFGSLSSCSTYSFIRRGSRSSRVNFPAVRRSSQQLCLSLIILLLVGCNQTKSSGKVISSKVNQEGISLTLSRTQETLTTVELLRLTLDVKAPQGSEFYFPNEESDFGDFTYFESHITSMKLNAENMVEQKYSLVLEPGLPGSHTVPRLTVQYGNQLISSEPFKIEVSSILPAEKTEIRDITSLTSPAGFLGLSILGVLIVIMFFDAALIKEGHEEEKVEYGAEALNKISKASLAEIPKIFCDFLSNHFNQQVAYTGAESLVDYLKNQQVDSGLVSEIEKALYRYEESRFANVEDSSLKLSSDSFIHLIQKLEGKA